MTKPTVEELLDWLDARIDWAKQDAEIQDAEYFQALRERLVGEQQTRQEILKPSTCGVSGHFAFQLNGGHCIMCQRESNLVATAREEAIRQLIANYDIMGSYAIHSARRALKPITEAGGGETK